MLSNELKLIVNYFDELECDYVIEFTSEYVFEFTFFPATIKNKKNEIIKIKKNNLLSKNYEFKFFDDENTNEFIMKMKLRWRKL